MNICSNSEDLMPLKKADNHFIIYESCDSALHYHSSLSTLVGFDLLNCTTFCIDQLMEKTMASDTQLEL